MAHPHRPRANGPERDSGFDVWIPAGVAILAALFLLTGAHAAEPTGAPRPLYDPTHFSSEAIAREAESVAEANAPAHDYTRPAVIVAPLAPPAQPKPAASTKVVTAPALTPPAADVQSGLVRLGVAGGIVALLVTALVALRRTWTRQRPLAI